ncbi:MAG: glycoside hydrolase family 92 protein, partial [Phaeodactylibacter sp.]|nr:glycoside hydrolase family 92 protein [Phaeodactylibacter sp.]
PQDVQGLIALHGGPENLEAKLDELFTTSSETTGREQADITGLIGQYAHGNEPSHHMAYLYNYVGKPWKTQERVRQILQELYANAPEGLSGNEDCGQMSAWYVFSAMGIYPVTPGSLDYIIGTPLLKRAVLHLENGNTFTFEAPNLTESNLYIQKVRLNGQPYEKSYIPHAQLMAGGTLEFVMGDAPNPSWGTSPEHRPWQQIPGEQIMPVPFFSDAKPAFFNQDTLRIGCVDPDASIFYTTDDRLPNGAKGIGTRYEGPIVLDASSTVKAVAYHEGKGQSRVVEATFLKIPEGRKLTLETEYANQYAASGDAALIDFLRGGSDFRTGEWQGYHGVDLIATVDLGQIEPIKKVGIRFLQDENSWIFMPEEVQFSFSSDSTQFSEPQIVRNTILPTTTGTVLKTFEVTPPDAARYIHIHAKNRGTCPEGHKGEGGKAWIFADEIEAN